MRLAFDVPPSVAAARAIQERLRDRVIRTGSPDWSLVAGVDASYRGDVGRAAVVVMDRDLRVVEEAVAEAPIPFPYVPGYLSFREIPVLLAAWRKLRAKPELVVVDGQGLAHPRRFGVASHFGVVIDLPTIGCAKSRLIGAHDEPGRERGAWTPLTDGRRRIGAALRTRTGTNVVYVSTGHRISLAAAVRTVLALAPRYRLPEPQRLADQLSKRPWTSSASSA
ncbi:MAG TPA: deoxyribonuclease V [Planctomycetota bacterium]